MIRLYSFRVHRLVMVALTISGVCVFIASPVRAASCTRTIAAGDTAGLESAILSASSGTTICLSSGTYYFSEHLAIEGKKIKLLGSSSSSKSILDGSNRTGIFQIEESDLSIENLVFQNAYGEDAIYATSSTLTITNSTFHHNNAGVIDAVLSSVDISASTFNNNTTSGSGGAIYADYSDVSIVNSTFNQNWAGYYGGVFYIEDPFGEYSFAAYNNTFHDNSAADIGAVIYSKANITIKGNIFSKGSATQPLCYSPGAYDITSLGYNLASDSSCFADGKETGDIANVANMGLDSGLKANGGSTQTIALLSTSPAIHAGNCTDTTPIDQRGLSRHTPCDAGAFEYYSTNFAPVISSFNALVYFPQQKSTTAEVTLKVSASDPDGSINRVEFYKGSYLVNTDSTSPYEYKLSLKQGTYTYKAKAYDQAGASSEKTYTVNVYNPYYDYDYED